VTTQAADVSSALASVLDLLGQAIALAQRIQSATDLADARRSADDLATLTQRISDQGLQPAQTAMNVILKAEGLLK
jgi:hypothetical protein